MRDRLIELVRNASAKWYQEAVEKTTEMSSSAYIADYLLANGVIVPPCKVGDSCYPLPRYRTPIVERKVSRITFSKRNIIIGFYENDGQYRPPLRTRILGEDIFLTKEEAEKALEEREKK